MHKRSLRLLVELHTVNAASDLAVVRISSSQRGEPWQKRTRSSARVRPGGELVPPALIERVLAPPGRSPGRHPRGPPAGGQIPMDVGKHGETHHEPRSECSAISSLVVSQTPGWLAT